MPETQLQHAQEDRSLGELLSELVREITTLVREEATLAKAEIGQKLARIGKHVGLVAAGGTVAYAGILAILAAMIILLAQAGMDLWASALLVGIVVAGIGGFLVWKGLDSLRREDLAPRQTLETLKEDTQWAKEQVTQTGLKALK
jgi:hypothetical protein